MGYIDQLGDLERPVEEAFEFARRVAEEVTASELELYKQTANAIMWEHDLLIISRQARKVRVLTEEIDTSVRG